MGGGNSSNHSGSMNRANTVGGGGSRIFGVGGAGAAGTSGYNDVLDNEISRPTMNRGASTNLLSDAGSKYGGPDDDNLSQYMG